MKSLPLLQVQYYQIQPHQGQKVKTIIMLMIFMIILNMRRKRPKWGSGLAVNHGCATITSRSRPVSALGRWGTHELAQVPLCTPFWAWCRITVSQDSFLMLQHSISHNDSTAYNTPIGENHTSRREHTFVLVTPIRSLPMHCNAEMPMNPRTQSVSVSALPRVGTAYQVKFYEIYTDDLSPVPSPPQNK